MMIADFGSEVQTLSCLRMRKRHGQEFCRLVPVLGKLLRDYTIGGQYFSDSDIDICDL